PCFQASSPPSTSTARHHPAETTVMHSHPREEEATHVLVPLDAPVRGALEDVDRLFLARMTVHDRRLARFVAGDLRPELIGLEEHLAYALVGVEGLERVEIEHLGDSRRRGDRGLVHRRLSSAPTRGRQV